MVNLKQLQDNAKKLENDEREARNKINSFKIDLYNMKEDIDDFEKLKLDFYNLRKNHCEGYKPEEPNHELEGEFENQKSKMKNRVLELQQDLINLKKKHKENISSNRIDNSTIIGDIVELKKNIEQAKKNKEKFSGDLKHANAVADIKAGEYIKNLMLKEISLPEKIELFKNKIEQKKKELDVLKKEKTVEDMEGRKYIIDENGDVVIDLE